MKPALPERKRYWNEPEMGTWESVYLLEVVRGKATMPCSPTSTMSTPSTAGLPPRMAE